MRVRSLEISGFRNLESAVLKVDPDFNIIVGDNGQGKTNLLEAIFFAAGLRSFRVTHVQELVQCGVQEAMVRAWVERWGFERSYEARISGRRRQSLLDGKPPRRLSDYFGGFTAVLFTPEDLSVARGSPAGRRRFLDRAVFNRNVTFLQEAQRYVRLLKTRNALLRRTARDEALLAAFDAQFVASGEQIKTSRLVYLDALRPLFKEAFQQISQSGNIAELDYYSSWDGPLADALVEARPRDLSRSATSVGPHADDLHFLLDGRLARLFASQGQLRALVLAWKTAEIKLVKSAAGDAPLLLLDDVTSELDSSRREYLWSFLGTIEAQCFVTATHLGAELPPKNGTCFRMVAGRVEA